MTDWKKREEAIAAWRASGKTARVFASGLGIGPSTLQWWARELRERASATASSAMTTAPRGSVSVPIARIVRPGEHVDRSSDAPVTLDVDGVRIAVHSDFDEKLLARVVRALRGASA